MWTSRLSEPAAPDGRAGLQPGSARHANRGPRRCGGTDLGRARSMPLGGSPGGGGGDGGAALAEWRDSADDAAGSVAGDAASSVAGDAASSADNPQPKMAPAGPASAQSAATNDAAAAGKPADASAAAIAAGTAADEPGTAAPDAASEPPAPEPVPAAQADAADPLLAPLKPAAPSSTLLGLSLRPAVLRSGGAPKPYSPAKRAFSGGLGTSPPAPATPQPSPLAQAVISAAPAAAAPAAAASMPNGVGAGAGAKAHMNGAVAANPAALLPACSGDLLPAAEEAFLRSLGWTDCTENEGLGAGLSDQEIAAFRAQQGVGRLQR